MWQHICRRIEVEALPDGSGNGQVWEREKVNGDHKEVE